MVVPDTRLLNDDNHDGRLAAFQEKQDCESHHANSFHLILQALKSNYQLEGRLERQIQWLFQTKRNRNDVEAFSTLNDSDSESVRAISEAGHEKKRPWKRIITRTWREKAYPSFRWRRWPMLLVSKITGKSGHFVDGRASPSTSVLQYQHSRQNTESSEMSSNHTEMLEMAAKRWKP